MYPIHLSFFKMNNVHYGSLSVEALSTITLIFDLLNMSAYVGSEFCVQKINLYGYC